MPLCQYLRSLAASKGISAVDLENHILTAAVRQARRGRLSDRLLSAGHGWSRECANLLPV